jgi:hypothetical protein
LKIIVDESQIALFEKYLKKILQQKKVENEVVSDYLAQKG